MTATSPSRIATQGKREEERMGSACFAATVTSGPGNESQMMEAAQHDVTD